MTRLDRLASLLQEFGLPEEEAIAEAGKELDRLAARLRRYERIKAVGDMFYNAPRPEVAKEFGISRKTVYADRARLLLYFRKKVTTAA